jgi:phage terminase large subunit GpA-like protein
VPEGVVLITGGVDVHKRHTEYCFRGWGPGWTSWLIDYGIIDSPKGTPGQIDAALAQVRDIAQQGWPQGGNTVYPALTFIDSGWEPGRVYSAVKAWGGLKWHASKGAERIKGLYQHSKLSNGVTLWTLNAGEWKGRVHSLLRVAVGEAGYFHLPAEVEQYYCKQVTAEALTTEVDNQGREKTRWKPLRKANHLLDCEAMAAAAASIRGVETLGKKDAARPKRAPRARAGIFASGTARKW